MGKTAAVYACAQELGFKVCGVLSFLSAFLLFITNDPKAFVLHDVYNLNFFFVNLIPFQIFEVNASCQRSGRQILSQLKEATQSHQVDKKGVNAHKPCFFNSCSTAKSPSKCLGSYLGFFVCLNYGVGFREARKLLKAEFPK